MSLINDALKKAQKQRTGESPALDQLPSIGGESPARISRNERSGRDNSMVVGIAVVSAAVLTVLVGAFFLIRWIVATPDASPAAVAVATTGPIPPTATAPAVPVVSVAPAPIEPAAVNPTATAADAIPAVAANPPAPTLAPAPEPPKPAEPPPKMDAKATFFIDSIHITGVRASETGSKVLMNDRIYRIGDIVEHNLGIKLSAITSVSLTFEDEQGATYTRSF